MQICMSYFGWRLRAGRLVGLVAMFEGLVVALAAMFEGLVVDVGNRFQRPADSGMKTDSPTNSRRAIVISSKPSKYACPAVLANLPGMLTDGDRLARSARRPACVMANPIRASVSLMHVAQPRTASGK